MVTREKITGRIFFKKNDLISLIGDFLLRLRKKSENATITIINSNIDTLISDGIKKLFIIVTI